MSESPKTKSVVEWKRVAPPLLGAAAIWSAFSMALSFAGHQPSGPSPFPPEMHYGLQAALLPIAFVFAFFGASKVIRSALGAVGEAPDAIRLATTWSAYAVCGSVVVAFLVPDIVVYSTDGFAALGPLLKTTGPAVVVTSIVSVAMALKRMSNVTWARASITSLLFTAFFFFLLSLVVR